MELRGLSGSLETGREISVGSVAKTVGMKSEAWKVKGREERK